jgi:hypothetical protein
MKRKRLFYDIETSFNIIADFSCGYNKIIRPNQIIKERQIICISYKWEDEWEVKSLDWGKRQCDKNLLKKFVKVMGEADELVAHNGDRFDIKWIKSRCLFHGIETDVNYRTIDTLKMARSTLYMNSNKLDYLAGYFDIGGKTDTGGFDLWKSVCLDNDQSALKKMVEYCENDVMILEGVFNKLRKITKAKTHYGALWDGNKFTCPECGTAHVRMRKRYTTTTGVMRFNMRCKMCETTYTLSGKQYQELLNYKMLNGIK